jgi:hypothetical protein
MVIGEVEDIKRKYEMPQFRHFNNQQSTIITRQSSIKVNCFWLFYSRLSPIYSLEPPAPPPSKPNAEGGEAYFRYRELSCFDARGWRIAVRRVNTHR